MSSETCMVPLYTDEVVGREPMQTTFRFTDPGDPKAGVITIDAEVSFVADDDFEALGRVEFDAEVYENLTTLFEARLGELLQRQILQQAGLGPIRTRRAA